MLLSGNASEEEKRAVDEWLVESERINKGNDEKLQKYRKETTIYENNKNILDCYPTCIGQMIPFLIRFRI